MPKGRRKVDRLAVAQAKSYIQGVNQEKDQHHCFIYLTESTFDKKDTQDVYKVCEFAIKGLPAGTNYEKWISKLLIKADIIKDIRRAKHMFTHYDLMNIHNFSIF
ncbi:uncharacterized protein P174DRAFT_502570 [Aspergillus novofumigatus IBT 16806]|uniref:Uncharacterized protein n=1 Tax=Aspergillus novofumigatus (strain IBT 16806) TaxID=1392255 RepID=A0A2I1CC01_ASPN1|nr:uncharacterized protein P174DRAFT_502570 [Aspergillus novofumigatus IBT 16806]PKX95159.1 hypothetical protein P174DRAFT_502570 [Aspergillus novofumigatus IBT 16806]